MHNTTLIRNADVEVTASTNRRNNGVAVAAIRGLDQNGRQFETEHRFAASSRISRALEDTPVEQITRRLNNGHYFFVDNELYDFRDGDYKGFVHTDDSIAAMRDTIGITSKNNRTTSVARNVALTREWSRNEISIDQFGDGGKFESSVMFSWSPFVRYINTSFDIIRLICENGMTGMTSLFNAKIPLENRWDEHLDIASIIMQNKLDGMLSSRFAQMGDERATVADCLLLQKHASDRLLETVQLRGNTGDADRLRNISHAVAPDVQLRDYYKPAVYQDKHLSAQLPSHLSAFDAYNIATELASHTPESDGSSNFALDRFANVLVFDRNDKSQHASRYNTKPAESSFSDPDMAFFGDVVAA